MKCYACKKQVKLAWSLPIISRKGIEKFRWLCEDCKEKRYNGFRLTKEGK